MAFLAICSDNVLKSSCIINLGKLCLQGPQFPLNIIRSWPFPPYFQFAWEAYGKLERIGHMGLERHMFKILLCYLLVCSSTCCLERQSQWRAWGFDSSQIPGPSLTSHMIMVKFPNSPTRFLLCKMDIINVPNVCLLWEVFIVRI